MAESRKTSQKSAAKAASQIPTKRSEYFDTVYTNISRVGFSPWDIRITFGLIGEDQNSASLFNEEQISVYMTPEHALALLKALKTTITSYEHQVKKIDDLEDILQKKSEAAMAQKKDDKPGKT